MRLILRIYLDDCAFSKRLRDNLRAEGHTVETPFDSGLVGADDEKHFAYAKSNGFILITLNPRDFVILHEKDPAHSGIFAVYQDNDLRDMTYAEIARAITNLMRAQIQVAGHFHVLNAWRS